MAEKNKNKQTNKQTNKTKKQNKTKTKNKKTHLIAFLSSFSSVPPFFFFFLFFFLKYHFFFFLDKYSGVWYMHANAQHQWKKEKKRNETNDFRLKKTLNPLHFRDPKV